MNSNTTQTQTDTTTPAPKMAPPAEYQIGLDDRPIYAHAIAFPPDFGEVSSDFFSHKILDYWKHNTVLYENYKSFGQVILEDILDQKKLPMFAEGVVKNELELIVSSKGVFYQQKMAGIKLDWNSLFTVFHKIAQAFDSTYTSIPIKKYILIVDQLSYLKQDERLYAIKVLENKVGGDLTLVAAMSDIKNVNYFMSKLKLANIAPLLHALFLAPTVTGKITALVRIIELYDLMWQDVQWTSVEKFAEFLFKVIDWIMEKTRLAKDFAVSGFQWVKAKTSGEESKEDIAVEVQKQASNDPISCTCGKPAVLGCSICGLHYCTECSEDSNKVCVCPTFADGIHTIDKCECSNNNDCFFRAYSQATRIPVNKIKNQVLRELNSDFYKNKYERLRKESTNSESWLDWDEFRKEIIKQTHIHNMCDDQMALFLTIIKRIGIVIIRTQIEDDFQKSTYYANYPINPDKVVVLELDANYYHYVMSELPPPEFDEIDYYLWGAPYDGKFKNVPLTPQPRQEKIDRIIDKSAYQPEKITIPQVIPADELDKLDLISNPESEVSSTFSSDTSSVISDMKQEIEKYVKIAKDTGSRQASEAGSEPKTVEENQNDFNECIPQESFWELLTSCQWNAVGARVVEWFKKMSKEVISFFESNPLMTGIISIVVGIATFLGISVTTFCGSASSIGFLKRLTEATRSMYYAERGVSSIMKAFETTVDAAKEVLGISKNSEIDKFKIEVSEACDLAREMLAVAANRPGEFINDGANFQKFRKNMDLIRATYSNLARMTSAKELAQIQPIWYNLSRTFEKLHQVYNKMMNCAMTRQEPVIVYLYGGTGLGKSRMINHIINKLNEKTGRSMQVFTISKGPEYWNGYAQQDIVRIDDMNAVIGPEGDTDSIALFNLATNAPYNPNMANLEDKCIMATPKFVFVASNHPTVPTDSVIQLREAWERRRDFFVHVSWPGHESCPKHTQNCEHWQKVLAPREDGTRPDENFDHLKLKLCNPMVSQEMTVRTTEQLMARHKKKPAGKQYIVKKEDQILEEGVDIDLDGLITCIIGKEAEQRAKFEQVVKKSILAGSIKQAASWSTNPSALLIGPPGTGKSHIFQRVSERLTTKKRWIKNADDFERYAAENFTSVESSTVFFNDLSALTQHPRFEAFLEELHQRYDRNTVPTDIWLIAANECVLNTAILQCGKSEEYMEVLYRRCELFRTVFKKKKNKCQVLFAKICKKDVETHFKESDIVDKTKMDDFVEYFHNGEKLTQESVVDRLSLFKPQVNEVTFHNDLAEAYDLPVTAVFALEMNSQEFLDLVNNASIWQIFKIIKSGKCKSMTKTLSAADLCKKIQEIINEARGMLGARFDSLDALLLEAWNKSYVKKFQGECFVLQLRDKKYYINAMTPDIECGIFKKTSDEIRELVLDLQMTTKVIETSTLMEHQSILPHWLVLTGEIISTVFNIIITGTSAIYSIKDQHEMFASHKLVRGIYDVINSGVAGVQENAKKELKAAIDGVAKPKMYPGIQKLRQPQYMDIEDEPNLLQNEGRNQIVYPEGKDYRIVYPEGKDYRIVYPEGRNQIVYPEMRHPSEPYLGDTSCPDTDTASILVGADRRKKRIKKKKNTVEFSDDILKKQRATDIKKEYTYELPKPDISKTGPAFETLRFQVAIRDVATSKHFQTVKEALEPVVQKEMCTDPSLYTIVERMLKNCVEICDKTGARLCSGLCIRHACVRTVLHLTEFCPVRDLRVRTLDGRTWPVTEIYRDEVTDRLDLHVNDNTFPPAADVTSHFPNMSSTIMKGANCVLVTPNISLITGLITVVIRPYIVDNLTIQNFTNYKVGLYAIEYHGHRTGYKLTGVQTKDGDCGSLLILLDTTWQDGKVLGMHIAATQTRAYASPFRKQQYLDKIKFQSNLNVSVSTQWFDPPKVEQPHYVAHSKVKCHIPTKTRLYRNWFPIGEKKFEPAILSGRDTRGKGGSLLRSECLKWCIEREGLSSDVRDDLRQCMVELAYHYAYELRKSGVVLRKLTSTEALNKLKGSNASEPLNLATSAGFPWNRISSKRGKHGYLVVTETGERRFSRLPEDQPCVQKLMDEINRLEHIPKGRNSDVIFQCFLKDELRPLAKIYDNPSTRTIAAAPLHYTIVHRKYFYSAIVALMENWEKLSVTVGISPSSLDWHVMFTDLLSVSTHGSDLDFKGWDFSIHPFILSLLSVFYQILFEELDPDCSDDDQAVRAVLIEKLVCFLLLVGDELWKTTGGIPSGYPGTSPDNSIINDLLHFYAWKQIMRRASPPHANIKCFLEETRRRIYGDDVIEAISLWSSQWYNGVTVAEVFRKIGFNPQPASKKGEIEPIKPLKDCIFLSRGFKMQHGIWMGPLEYDKMCKPTHYCHDRRSHEFWKSPDEETKAADIVENVYQSLLYEAALHSEVVFKKFYDVATQVMLETDGPPLPSYADALQQIYCIQAKGERIRGVTLLDCSEVLEMNWQHAIPENHARFTSRLSYTFGPDYSYTGSPKTNPFPRNLQKIVDHVNTRFKTNYNSLLVNRYPVGGHIPWHKDTEPEVDQSEGVFGLTMSGDGRIEFKNATEAEGYYLDPGIGYLMDQYNLENYFHRRVEHHKETITFTFRKIVPRQ